MKVDKKYEVDVEYGFFDDEYDSFLTKDEYESLIRNKLARAKFYQEQHRKIIELMQF